MILSQGEKIKELEKNCGEIGQLKMQNEKMENDLAIFKEQRKLELEEKEKREKQTLESKQKLRAENEQLRKDFQQMTNQMKIL